MSSSCLVIALVYISRAIERFDTSKPVSTRTPLVLSELNVHRIIIASVVLAIKFFEDEFYNNSFFSRLGGISIAEMNLLERELLMRLQVYLSLYSLLVI